MSASLIEMVLAIVIAGLIFASAIIPTTQTAAAYQENEADARQATWQVTATVRTEQVAGNVWRDAEPPDNHDALLKAMASQLWVGDWKLRHVAERYEQNGDSGGWATIAEPVENAAFQYLLNDGTWVSSANSQLDDVLAVRFDWSSTDNGRKYGGLMVAPDRAFSGGVVELFQGAGPATYSRPDYERTITFSLGSWQ
jgi:type II secretory pathway pseudopilin PulG